MTSHTDLSAPFANFLESWRIFRRGKKSFSAELVEDLAKRALLRSESSRTPTHHHYEKSVVTLWEVNLAISRTSPFFADFSGLLRRGLKVKEPLWRRWRQAFQAPFVTCDREEEDTVIEALSA